MSKRVRTIIAALVVTVLVATATFAIVGLRLYVIPSTDKPAKSDAIFVIGPATPERLAIAQKLMGEGLSKNLMVSTNAAGRYSSHRLHICNAKENYRVYCEVPNPGTTQGEARWLQSISAKHGWRSATVITFTPHVTRARLIMARCFDGDIRMIADRSSLGPLTWLYEFFYQTGGFVKAELQPGC